MHSNQRSNLLLLHCYEKYQKCIEWWMPNTSWCSWNWGKHQTSIDRGACAWPGVASWSTRIYYRVLFGADTRVRSMGQSPCRRRVSLSDMTVGSNSFVWLLSYTLIVLWPFCIVPTSLSLVLFLLRFVTATGAFW